MRMTLDRAENVLARLRVFEKLDRKATDEVGWIALAFSVNRKQAEKLMAQAKKLLEPKGATR